MQTAAPQQRDIVTWDDLDRLVAGLADRLADQSFDLLLAITRGGLVPAGMLAYRLRIRNILVAAVEFYDDHGPARAAPDLPPVPGRSAPARPAHPGRRRGLGQRDDDPRGDRTDPAGGRPPDDRRPPLETDPLGRAGAPDVHAVTTDAWVVYPFKAGG